MDRRGTRRLSQAAKPPNTSTCSGFCDLRLPDGRKTGIGGGDTQRFRHWPCSMLRTPTRMACCTDRGATVGQDVGSDASSVWAANAVPIWQATMPGHATVVTC